MRSFEAVIEYQIQQEDEDRKIEKLEQHRKMKMLIVNIGKSVGIDISPTYDDDSNGDFRFPQNSRKDLEKAIDKYLGDFKVR